MDQLNIYYKKKRILFIIILNCLFLALGMIEVREEFIISVSLPIRMLGLLGIQENTAILIIKWAIYLGIILLSISLIVNLYNLLKKYPVITLYRNKFVHNNVFTSTSIEWKKIKRCMYTKKRGVNYFTIIPYDLTDIYTKHKYLKSYIPYNEQQNEGISVPIRALDITRTKFRNQIVQYSGRKNIFKL